MQAYCRAHSSLHHGLSLQIMLSTAQCFMWPSSPIVNTRVVSGTVLRFKLLDKAFARVKSGNAAFQICLDPHVMTIMNT